MKAKGCLSCPPVDKCDSGERCRCQQHGMAHYMKISSLCLCAVSPRRDSEQVLAIDQERHTRGKSKVASPVHSSFQEGPIHTLYPSVLSFSLSGKKNIVLLLVGLFLIIQQTIPCIIGPTDSYCQTSKWEELKLSTELNFWKMEKEKARR